MKKLLIFTSLLAVIFIACQNNEPTMLVDDNSPATAPILAVSDNGNYTPGFGVDYTVVEYSL